MFQHTGLQHIRRSPMNRAVRGKTAYSPFSVHSRQGNLKDFDAERRLKKRCKVILNDIESAPHELLQPGFAFDFMSGSHTVGRCTVIAPSHSG